VIPLACAFSEAKGEVDVDLSCEGSATKISRHQAYVTLDASGVFRLTNAGQRVLAVDGKQVHSGVDAAGY
jgi:hypothetical protein